MPGWRPVELVKLCCNSFVNQIYTNNEKMFLFELKRYDLPEDIHNIIFERYKFIKFVYQYVDEEINNELK
tara:strand:- start:38154 stop:38363 length:210 start_codon:yes stop_codon:yes gene_type:complete